MGDARAFLMDKYKLDSADKLFQIVSLFCAKASNQKLSQTEETLITIVSDTMMLLAGKTIQPRAPATARCDFLLANQTKLRETFMAIDIPDKNVFSVEDLQKINAANSTTRMQVIRGIAAAKNVVLNNKVLALLALGAAMYVCYSQTSVISGLANWVTSWFTSAAPSVVSQSTIAGATARAAPGVVATTIADTTWFSIPEFVKSWYNTIENALVGFGFVGLEKAFAGMNVGMDVASAGYDMAMRAGSVLGVSGVLAGVGIAAASM